MHDILAALRRAESTGRPWVLCDALGAAGRSYRQLGALSPALAMFEQALRWSRVTGGADQTVDVHCELCETHTLQYEAIDPDDALRRQSARDHARAHAHDAARLSVHATDARWEVTVLLRLSDLLDRLGDHDDAIELQVRALRQMSGPADAPPPDASTAHGTLH